MTTITISHKNGYRALPRYKCKENQIQLNLNFHMLLTILDDRHYQEYGLYVQETSIKNEHHKSGGHSSIWMIQLLPEIT